MPRRDWIRRPLKRLAKICSAASLRTISLALQGHRVRESAPVTPENATTTASRKTKNAAAATG
jgi:hypothetical protein